MNIEKLSSLAISDSGFVFDPSSGHSFTTNDVGIDIIHLLKTEKDLSVVKEKLTEMYDTTENEVEVDVTDFIDSLKKLYLI